MASIPRRAFLKKASILAAGATLGVDLSSCSDGSKPAAPARPPSAPTDLTATVLSAGSIALAWVDASDDETSFRIERAREAGPFATAGSVPADTTGFLDTGLDPDTVYSYRVFAVNDAGESAPSGTGTAKTLAPVELAPAAPSGVTATALSPRSVQVDWIDESDNEEVFRIERRTETGEYAAVGTRPRDSTTFTDESVLPDTEYSFRVIASNARGDSAPSGEARTRTPIEPPGVPASVVVTAVSSSSIRVDFEAARTGGAATEFRIERKQGSAGSFVFAGAVPGDARTFEDTGLASRQEYFYRVQGVNAAGAGPFTRGLEKATTWFAILFSAFPDLARSGGLYCEDLPRERGEYRLAVYRVSASEAVAYDRTCTHQQTKIGCSDRSDTLWICPLHGSTFALDGRRIDGAALSNLPQYPARIAADRIEVQLAPFAG
jgi:Rieske Fe-S protein